jgi:hypothetical protein
VNLPVPPDPLHWSAYVGQAASPPVIDKEDVYGAHHRRASSG